MQSLLITNYLVSKKNFKTTRTNNTMLPMNPLVFCGKYPDLKQYSLPGVSEYFCGPVSAANGIISLSENGFPELFKSGNPAVLINELGAYFKTNKQGTTTNNLCTGLESYISSKGYKAKIQYQGFRPTEQKYQKSLIPDLQWIKQELDKQNVVILNLGIYKKQTINGQTVYRRQYGHFVNATGKNTNGLQPDANYISIHDPYDRVSGDRYIKTTLITEGKFIHNSDDNETTLSNNAKGFTEIPTRFNYFAADEVAVIDGAISVEVRK